MTGISEEFPCAGCGDIYLSPRAALMCEDRDNLEAKAAQRQPKTKRPSNIIRAID